MWWPLCCSRRFLDAMITFRCRHVIVNTSKWPTFAWGRGIQSKYRSKREVFSHSPKKPVVIICLSHEINLSLVHYFDSQTTAKQICSFELFERIRIGVSVHKLKKTTDRSAPAPKNGTTFWNVYQERQGDVINTRR